MSSRAFYFDPDASGLAVFLGSTEARLMELAWKEKKLTVKRAQYFLNQDGYSAYTTVMTVLARLARKGLLKREKSGRLFVYRPALSRQEFVRDRTNRVSICLKRNFKTNI